MTHILELQRADKSKVRIEVRFIYSHSVRENSTYDFEVYFCPPRKRTWVNVVKACKNSFEYFKANTVEREKIILSEKLKYVTKEEIHAAKLEMWEKLKPIE